MLAGGAVKTSPAHWRRLSRSLSRSLSLSAFATYPGLGLEALPFLFQKAQLEKREKLLAGKSAQDQKDERAHLAGKKPTERISAIET